MQYRAQRNCNRFLLFRTHDAYFPYFLCVLYDTSALRATRTTYMLYNTHIAVCARFIYSVTRAQCDSCYFGARCMYYAAVHCAHTVYVQTLINSYISDPAISVVVHSLKITTVVGLPAA